MPPAPRASSWSGSCALARRAAIDPTSTAPCTFRTCTWEFDKCFVHFQGQPAVNCIVCTIFHMRSASMTPTTQCPTSWTSVYIVDIYGALECENSRATRGAGAMAGAGREGQLQGGELCQAAVRGGARACRGRRRAEHFRPGRLGERRRPGRPRAWPRVCISLSSIYGNLEWFQGG